MTEDFKNKFCNAVVKYVSDNEESYIDAVLAVSEKFGFGPEMGGKLLTKPLIEKIRIEGEEINMIPKMSQLPF